MMSRQFSVLKGPAGFCFVFCLPDGLTRAGRRVKMQLAKGKGAFRKNPEGAFSFPVRIAEETG